MKRCFRNPEHWDELFHRHGEAGLQIVEFPHGETGMKKLNQFGRGEVLGSDSRAGAMHAVVDNAWGFEFLPSFAAGHSLCGLLC